MDCLEEVLSRITQTSMLDTHEKKGVDADALHEEEDA